MKNRVGDLIGGVVEGMQWLGTFHSIGAKILRRHAELVGLKSDFTILDTDDQIRLMKQIIDGRGHRREALAGAPARRADRPWKNRGLVAEGRARGRRAAPSPTAAGEKLYAAYQERLKTLNAADFGDLLLEPLRIFREHPDVLADYHKRFRYMLVDEYQDTNVAQYLWLRLLAQGQAQHLLRRRRRPVDLRLARRRGRQHPALREGFSRRQGHPPGAQLPLDRRTSSAPPRTSSPTTRAGSARRCSPTRTDPDAPQVSVASSWDSEEEARAVGEEIEQLQRKGHKLNEIAILVRASFQMRAFEDRFVTLGLNYRVIGGPRFYERQEIRDALAYFRVTAQPADDLAFERIVNMPRRGIGEATVKLLHDRARARRVPLMEAAAELVETDELAARTRTALRDLLAAFARWRGQLDALRHTELAEMILEESGYTEMWQADRSADAPGRLENLKELVRSMEEFELDGRLPRARLAGHGRRRRGRQRRGQHHDAALGQGARVRHACSCPAGRKACSPRSARSTRTAAPASRRSAASPMSASRGRGSAPIIRFASNRRMHGLWQTAIPSRFLDELPEAHVDVVEDTSSYGGYGVGRLRRRAASTPATRSRTPTPRPAGSAPRRTAAAATRRPWAATATSPARSRSQRLIEGELVAKSVVGGALELSRPASASSTRNSATAASPRSTATSSPSTSRRPGRSACSTASSSGIEFSLCELYAARNLRITSPFAFSEEPVRRYAGGAAVLPRTGDSVFISVLARRLKPGKTYEDFIAAWYPDKGFGISGRGPILARNVADDREILAIGFINLPDRASLDEAMARIAAQEQVRHDRIAEVIEFDHAPRHL